MCALLARVEKGVLDHGSKPQFDEESTALQDLKASV